MQKARAKQEESNSKSKKARQTLQQESLEARQEAEAMLASQEVSEGARQDKTQQHKTGPDKIKQANTTQHVTTQHTTTQHHNSNKKQKKD
jgi:hypothetical protein